jgi:MFS family permease
LTRPAPFYGWVIVGGAFVVLFIGYGAQYAFGVFFAAMLEEFGWSRASLSGAFSLYAFAYCLFGFPAGRLTDRWGPRAVVAVGGLFLGAAFVGMALVTELWQPYVLYGLVAAVGMGTTYVPCNTTVVRWFVARRGLAVGIAGSGGSLGNFVMPPVAQLLVGALGWRAAYVVLGVTTVLVLTLVARVMRRDPESLGLHPDGSAAAPTGGGPEADPWPLREATRTAPFWLLAATFTATWIPVFIPLVHVVPLTRDLGHTPLAAASVVSVLGVGAMLGRLLLGAVSDRIGRKGAIAIAMGLQALTFLAFIVVRQLPALFVTAFVFGASYGAISTLFPAIVSDFFGRRQAGVLVGVLFAIAGSMAGIGPVAAGAIYDARGGYELAFALAAGLNALALLLLGTARPPAPGARV